MPDIKYANDAENLNCSFASLASSIFFSREEQRKTEMVGSRRSIAAIVELHIFPQFPFHLLIVRAHACTQACLWIARDKTH